SEPTLEEYKAITQSIASYMHETIAASRGLDPSVVSEWFKRSLFTSDETLSMNLVDKIAYKSNVLEDLIKTAKLKSSATLDYLDYLSVSENVLDRKVDSSGSGIAFI